MTTIALPMNSFACVGEIEHKEGKPTVAVCEVEKIDIKDSKTEERNKPVFKAYIPIQQITDLIGEIEEGDIIVVSHENDEVKSIICRDDAEKARRVELIERLQAIIFKKQ